MSENIGKVHISLPPPKHFLKTVYKYFYNIDKFITDFIALSTFWSYVDYSTIVHFKFSVKIVSLNSVELNG